MHAMALARHKTLRMRIHRPESTGDALQGNRRPLASADRGHEIIFLCPANSLGSIQDG